MLFLFFLLLTSGCAFQSQKETEPEQPQPSGKVPPAPKSFYITVGQSEEFTYWDHDIVISYLSASPVQSIKITVDGEEKTIERELTADPRGVYWDKGNLSFALKPVSWEVREGQRVPIYEGTWNTTELYFEVVSSVGPEERENIQFQVVP